MSWEVKTSIQPYSQKKTENPVTRSLTGFSLRWLLLLHLSANLLSGSLVFKVIGQCHTQDRDQNERDDDRILHIPLKERETEGNTGKQDEQEA